MASRAYPRSYRASMAFLLRRGVAGGALFSLAMAGGVGVGAVLDRPDTVQAYPVPPMTTDADGLTLMPLPVLTPTLTPLPVITPSAVPVNAAAAPAAAPTRREAKPSYEAAPALTTSPAIVAVPTAVPRPTTPAPAVKRRPSVVLISCTMVPFNDPDRVGAQGVWKVLDPDQVGWSASFTVSGTTWHKTGRGDSQWTFIAGNAKSSSCSAVVR